MPASYRMVGWGWICGAAAAIAWLTGCLAAWGSPSSATDPKFIPPFDVRLVHSDDPACARGCGEWLALSGKIGAGSAGRFAVAIRRLGARTVPILVDSPGGSVNDAMSIGRLIRAKHLDVVVGKTTLDTCAADHPRCAAPDRDGSVPGKAVASMARCASACSFILAAGTRRYVPWGTFVGVHQFREFRTLTRVMRYYHVTGRIENGVKVELSRTLVSVKPISSKRFQVATPAAEYSKAERYFADMGIKPSLMALAEQTPATSIHWLSFGELVTTGMDTDGMSAAGLIDKLNRPDDAKPLAVAPVATPQPTAKPDAFSSAGDNAEIYAYSYRGQTELRADGLAAWTLKDRAFGESRLQPTLVAAVDYGTAIGSVEVCFARSSFNVESYFVTLIFHPGTGDALKDVARLDQPVLSESRDSPGTPIAGPIVSEGPNEFRILLDATEANAALMRHESWFSVTYQTADHRAGRLLFERGQFGSETFRRWHSAAS